MRWWKKLWGNSDNAIKVARQSADISPDTTNSPSLSSVLSMPIDLPTETINLLTPHVDPIEAPVQPIPKGPLDGYPAPYSKGSHGETLLHLAAKEGDIDLAKALIENADMTALQWMQYINSNNSFSMVVFIRIFFV